MLAVVFLLLTTATGYLIARHFFSSLSTAASLAAGWIIGVLISTWLLILFIYLLGYELGIAATAISYLVLSWVLFLKRKKSHSALQTFSVNQTVFLMIWGIFFFSLFWHSSLRIKSDGYYTAPYTYGDLALHTTIINYFAQQNDFSLQHPLLSIDSIKYPFLLNFHSAILVRLGLSIQLILIMVGVMTMLSTFALIFEFAAKLSRHNAVPWIAAILYIFNGGFGWLLVLKETGNWSNLVTVLQKLPFDYTNIEPRQLFWTNITTTHVLPQRGFMIGLAVVMLCFYLLQKSWSSKKIELKQLFLISSIIGSSVLFHSHTFIFLAVLFVWLMGWAIFYKKITLTSALISMAPLLMLGGLQLAYIFNGNHHSFMQLQIGWKAHDNFVGFWLQNMGLDLVVLLVGTTLFHKLYQKQTFARLLILPSIGVYVLCNIFIFQPNDWDNMKFMSLAFLAPCVLSAVVIGDSMSTTFRKMALSLLVLFISISGLLSVLYVSQNSWILSSKKDMSIAEEIKKLTPSDSLFLTSEAHNHPVAMLAGRPVVLGYRGWLWTHGVEYSDLDQQIHDMYAGKDNAASLIKALNIEYVFISDKERTSLFVNQNYFAEHFPVLFQDNDVTIYKIE